MSASKNVPAPAHRDGKQPFAGFEHLEANYIYCPNQFFEVCLRHHSRGCVRLVAYILRQTLGWLDQNGDPLSQEISIPYLDLKRRARISTRAIPTAIAEAESGGFIRCVAPGLANANGQRGQAAQYQLRWADSDQYTDAPKLFRGFYSGDGHRSPIPNGFFDVLIPQETLGMSKVVGTVLRHTVGYQNQFGGRRSDAPLSFSYIQRFANISDRTTLSETLKRAIKQGFIRRVSDGNFDPRGGGQSRPAHYAVKWLKEAENSAKTAKLRPGELQDGKNPTEDTAKPRPVGDGKNPTATKTLRNNTFKQQTAAVAVENSEAYRLLTDVGFDKATATELFEGRGLQEINQQIAWLDERNPRNNKLGMLRKAIEQNWSKPVKVEQAEKKDRLDDRARRQTNQEQLDDAKAAEAKREQQRRRDAAQVRFDNMSEEERTAIVTATFERLNSDFFRKRFRQNADFQLQQCLDELCRREGIVALSPSLIT
ncbi:MAG: hypothetical protein HOH82_09765 [Planctomycetaceae bacterium]|jgi:hypothetical protein|nr:hypothetical protein [Planctomycetaceae bacterium]